MGRGCAMPCSCRAARTAVLGATTPTASPARAARCEPFEQAAACAALARQVRELGLDVWTYSGYRYEQLEEGIPDPAARDLLDQTDVLVDGPFLQAQHSYQLPWRGSRNQRLIDVPATRARGRIVLWETHEDFPVKPPSW